MGVSISPWLAIYAPRIYAFYVRSLAPRDVLLMNLDTDVPLEMNDRPAVRDRGG